MSLVCYATDHQHSKIICEAFAKGQGGRLAPPRALLDGPAMVYGILRGCDRIIKECEWIGRDYYYVDHGYINRGYYDGYFRVVKNGLQAKLDHEDDDGYVTLRIPNKPDWGARWKALGVQRRPWKKDGRHIVVCPISKAMGAFWGIDAERWTEAVCRELASHTDRPVQVKLKDGSSLREALEDAWCLVTHSSNAAIDAVLNGTPVITLGPSAAKVLSWGFDSIESPEWPADHFMDDWCCALANSQFTLDEMRRGIDLSAL